MALLRSHPSVALAALALLLAGCRPHPPASPAAPSGMRVRVPHILRILGPGLAEEEWRRFLGTSVRVQGDDQSGKVTELSEKGASATTTYTMIDHPSVDYVSPLKLPTELIGAAKVTTRGGSDSELAGVEVEYEVATYRCFVPAEQVIEALKGVGWRLHPSAALPPGLLGHAGRAWLMLAPQSASCSGAWVGEWERSPGQCWVQQTTGGFVHAHSTLAPPPHPGGSRGGAAGTSPPSPKE